MEYFRKHALTYSNVCFNLRYASYAGILNYIIKRSILFRIIVTFCWLRMICYIVFYVISIMP